MAYKESNTGNMGEMLRKLYNTFTPTLVDVFKDIPANRELHGTYEWNIDDGSKQTKDKDNG
jgi:hypothetical protein